MAEKRKYTDFANVETWRNFIIPEEYPEGSYGAPEGKYSPVENKSTPWDQDQQPYSAFTYENRNLHQDLPRQFPGAHPTHDDPNVNTEPPYEES